MSRDRNRKSGPWWDAYQMHLASPEWKAIRQKVIQRCNNICEGCGEAPVRHVHHLSYDNYNWHGREMLWELRGVCDRCHSLIHGWDEQPEVDPLAKAAALLVQLHRDGIKIKIDEHNVIWCDSTSKPKIPDAVISEMKLYINELAQLLIATQGITPVPKPIAPAPAPAPATSTGKPVRRWIPPNERVMPPSQQDATPTETNP